MAVLDEKYWQSFVGETIRGNTAWSNVYHIQKFVGRGGFGGVFKAEQDDTKELVAVKLMLPADAAAREIKTALKVPDHPNLIKHFEAIEADLKGTPMYVLVMELADGGSLRDLLNQGILNGVEVKKIALDIVEGLKHLHSIDATGSEEQKRVHRDMKPENVLQVKGVWKIADFGLAKVLENGSMPASEDAGGTPQYMPPEFLQRPNIVSTKWDIWSFGVILAEMLAGERPFDSYQPDANERKNDIYKKILLAKPNIPNVPKEWIPIIEGCLIKKHRSRLMATDVLKALDLMVEPVTQNQPSTDHVTSKGLWGTFITIGLITIGLISGVGFMIWQLVKPVNSPTVITSQSGSPSAKETVSSKTAEGFFKDGVIKADAKDYRGAITDYNEAIRLNPNYAETYTYRGIAKYQLADKEGAISDYNEAIRINPNYADAYNNRGSAKYGLGDKQGALTDYNEAIRLNPNHALAYNNRGLAKSDLGDKEGAITDYTQAIKTNQNWGNSSLADAYNKRGNAKYGLGDKQGAIIDYNEAIRINPNDVFPYVGRGLAKSNSGDKQGAIIDYNEAIRINPNYADAYLNRGSAKYVLGDKQGAITDFNESIRINPNHALAYKNRGYAKYELGDKQGAIIDYTQAIKTNQNWGTSSLAATYYNRGDTYQNLGEKQKALADFREASRLYQQQGKTSDYNDAEDKIRKLGG